MAETVTACKIINQQPQLNGYWLVTLELTEEFSIGQLLGRAWQLKPENHNLESSPIELWLFATTDKQQQFLSQQPLDDTQLNQTATLSSQQNHQVWLNDIDWNQELLVIADDLAMANAFVLAKQAQQQQTACQLVLATNGSFPFMVKPARFLMPQAPSEAIGACTLLEDWQAANRLVSQQGQAGCFDGLLKDFMKEFVTALESDSKDKAHKVLQTVLLLNDPSIDSQLKTQLQQHKQTIQLLNAIK